jgi:hypothetical protein
MIPEEPSELQVITGKSLAESIAGSPLQQAAIRSTPQRRLFVSIEGAILGKSLAGHNQ